jgi:hypothetical protein
MDGIKAFLPRALIVGLAFVGSHTVIAADANDAFVIGGWDLARADLGSFADGGFFEEARASLATNFPNASLTSFNTLSATSLGGVDVVILPTGVRNGNPITPLTQAEQDALAAFVAGGGGALLMPDNDSFGGPIGLNLPDADTIAANDSLIAPFGMAVTDTNVGFFAADVTDPTSTVTNGPFGVVNTITTVFPGRISDLGPDASPLAEVAGFGDVLAEIPAGQLGAGSGAVVILSDFNAILDIGDDGGLLNPTTENETMFLNIISTICRTGGGGGPPPGGGPLPIEIDILPNRQNIMKLKRSRGKLPVVILSGPDFDPCDVDPATLDLAGASASKHRWKDKWLAKKVGDRNDDGVKDLLVLFHVGNLDPAQIVDGVATLTGETFDGQEFEGSDELEIIRPKRCPRSFHAKWPKHWHQYLKDHYPDWKKYNKDWAKFEH